MSSLDLDAIRERGAIVPYSVEEHVRLTVEERDALVGRIQELEADYEEQRLEAICGLACELLGALQPWGFHSPEVRSAATRLTVAIAAVPVPESAQGAGE